MPRGENDCEHRTPAIATEDALFDAQSIQDIDQDLGAVFNSDLLPERIRLTHAGWIDKDDAVSGSEVLVLVAQQRALHHSAGPKNHRRSAFLATNGHINVAEYGLDPLLLRSGKSLVIGLEESVFALTRAEKI
jgi:hypothetical protein